MPGFAEERVADSDGNVPIQPITPADVEHRSAADRCSRRGRCGLTVHGLTEGGIEIAFIELKTEVYIDEGFASKNGLRTDNRRADESESSDQGNDMRRLF